ARWYREEAILLRQANAVSWTVYRERMEESGGLPKFVVSDFEEYLDCGRLEAGCILLECRSCGYSQLVAFSCKRRGFCPGCVARRMADTGVHLEQRVLPEAPVRHWICPCRGVSARCWDTTSASVQGPYDRAPRWHATVGRSQGSWLPSSRSSDARSSGERRNCLVSRA